MTDEITKCCKEIDFIPLSAIQHLFYCERQCALIHIERVWSENRYTAEGLIMHERVHTVSGESRGRVRVECGISLVSHRLGLRGKADVVEFHYDKKPLDAYNTIPIKVKPVEYKRGRPKTDHCDRVQLCAQAICLEEMLDVNIHDGSLFYGKTRRRQTVVFDKELRGITEDAAQRLHELIRSGHTPPPLPTKKKCNKCSLMDICLPKIVRKKRSVSRYLFGALKEP